MAGTTIVGASSFSNAKRNRADEHRAGEKRSHEGQALLPHRPDRSELKHHDGDGNPGHVSRARNGRTRALRLSLKPHADEEGHKGGAGRDGPRLRSLSARTVG